MARTLSPVATRSFKVCTTGRPAPTVDSFSHRAPLSRLVFKISSYSCWLPENAFLFGVTTCTPRFKNSGYNSATPWDAVLSTRTARSSVESCSASAGRSGVLDEDARSDDHEEGVTDSPSCEKSVRFDEVKETSLKGDGDGKERSCEISSEPTRPTPTMATESGGIEDIATRTNGRVRILFSLKDRRESLVGRLKVELNEARTR